MNQQEFEDTARRYREEMFRLYANQPMSPQPKPMAPPMTPPSPQMTTPPPPMPLPAPPYSGAETAPMVQQPMDLPQEQPMMPPPAEEYRGSVKVRVSTAKGARPVAGAIVTVVREMGGKEHIYALQKTNDSGETGIIELPAPPPSANQQAPQYYDYNIHVHAPGYYRESTMAMPVFPNILSLQSFDLIPLPAGIQPRSGGDLLFYNYMKDYTTGGEAHAQW